MNILAIIKSWFVKGKTIEEKFLNEIADDYDTLPEPVKDFIEGTAGNAVTLVEAKAGILKPVVEVAVEATKAEVKKTRKKRVKKTS